MSIIAALIVGYAVGTIGTFLVVLFFNKDSERVNELEFKLQYVRTQFAEASRHRLCQRCMTRKEIDKVMGVKDVY